MSAPSNPQPPALREATLTEALEYAEQHLRRHLPGAFEGREELRGEARSLLRLAAKCRDAHIYAWPNARLDADAQQRFFEFLQRRGAGEPLAYIEGRRGFHAIELDVDPRVLVPRPETELIVEAVAELAPPRPFSLADLGTGSGAIALAVAHGLSDVTVTGVDISFAALRLAMRNAGHLGLEIEWVESDWFGALAGRRFDFVCCNPPYVASDDPHMANLAHEPRIALDGGRDGLSEIRRVLTSAPSYLEPDGRLLLEHGYDQASAVESIGIAAGLRLERRVRDVAGHERVSQFVLLV